MKFLAIMEGIQELKDRNERQKATIEDLMVDVENLKIRVDREIRELKELHTLVEKLHTRKG